MDGERISLLWGQDLGQDGFERNVLGQAASALRPVDWGIACVEQGVVAHELVGAHVGLFIAYALDELG